MDRHETVVDVISVDTIDREKDQTVCDLLQYIDEPRVRRQVYLENKNKERLGYAVSWWSSHDVCTIIHDNIYEML